jgi:hypothetical protein
MVLNQSRVTSIYSVKLDYFWKPSVWSCIILSHAKQNQHDLEVHWMWWVFDPEIPTPASAVALSNSPVICSLIICHVWINWRFLYFCIFCSDSPTRADQRTQKICAILLGRVDFKTIDQVLIKMNWIPIKKLIPLFYRFETYRSYVFSIGSLVRCALSANWPSKCSSVGTVGCDPIV